MSESHPLHTVSPVRVTLPASAPETPRTPGVDRHHRALVSTQKRAPRIPIAVCSRHDRTLKKESCFQVLCSLIFFLYNVFVSPFFVSYLIADIRLILVIRFYFFLTPLVFFF